MLLPIWDEQQQVELEEYFLGLANPRAKKMLHKRTYKAYVIRRDALIPSSADREPWLFLGFSSGNGTEWMRA